MESDIGAPRRRCRQKTTIQAMSAAWKSPLLSSVPAMIVVKRTGRLKRQCRMPRARPGG